MTKTQYIDAAQYGTDEISDLDKDEILEAARIAEETEASLDAQIAKGIANLIYGEI